MRSMVRLSLLIACGLALPASVGLAQQAPRISSANTVRRGYYNRVQTQAVAPSTARRSSAYRPGLTTSRSIAGGGRLAAFDATYQSADDPMRAHANTGRAGTAPRPYERRPIVTPPEMTAPAPAVSHNYYPGLRPGQATNRNLGGSHCVPGRHAFLHR